jgi:hypothetical protein
LPLGFPFLTVAGGRLAFAAGSPAGDSATYKSASSASAVSRGAATGAR